jgi:hypothetical protein
MLGIMGEASGGWPRLRVSSKTHTPVLHTSMLEQTKQKKMLKKES